MAIAAAEPPVLSQMGRKSGAFPHIDGQSPDAAPGVSLDWNEGKNSWRPLSYQSMGRWMLEEAAANRYVRRSPFVSIGKKG